MGCNMGSNKVLRLLATESFFAPDDFDSGGLRRPGDYSQVDLALSENGRRMFCHTQSSFDEVILEIHEENDNDGNRLDKPTCHFFELDPTARWELAMYLLSTVKVIGK